MTEQNTRQKLMEAGKKEFLAWGFKGASLRRICKNAGVTTGALYFFFNGKEDLFREIVDKPLKVFRRLVDQSVEMELSDPDVYVVTEDRIIEFLLAHREECILLMDKAEGTAFAGFRERWQRKLEEIFAVFFNKYLEGPADPAIVHLVTSMRMQGYMELLQGNYPDEKAKKLVREMAVYADAGFFALIQSMNKEMKQ